MGESKGWMTSLMKQIKQFNDPALTLLHHYSVSIYLFPILLLLRPLLTPCSIVTSYHKRFHPQKKIDRAERRWFKVTYSALRRLVSSLQGSYVLDH